MKKLITTMILALTMTAAGFITAFAEETPTQTTEPTPIPTPTQTPTQTTEPTPTPTPTQTPTQTTEPTPTPTTAPPTETPTSLAIPEVVYTIKNGSCYIQTYKDGRFTTERMECTYKDKDDDSNVITKNVGLKNELGVNYVPFRYLFDNFEIKDESDKYKNFTEIDDFVKQDLQISEDAQGAYAYTQIGGKGYILLKVKNDNQIKEWLIEASGPIENPGLIRDIYNDGVTKKLTEKLTDIKGETKSDDSNYKSINVDGAVYISLRTLELIGMTVEYDSSTDAICIYMPKAEMSNEEIKKEIKNRVMEDYRKQFNDNYVQYAYAYKDNNGEVKTLKDNNERCYCVNQYGDMLVYLDNEQHIKVKDLKQDATYLVKYKDNENPIIADKIFFDGGYVYGIKIKNTSETSGEIFAAKLSFSYNNGGCNYELENMKKIEGSNAYQFLYKTIKNKDDGNYTKYLYYGDTKDTTIKRITINDLKNNIAIETVVDSEQKPINYVDGFGISEWNDNNCGYIIYNYHNESINIAKINENTPVVEHIERGDISVSALYCGIISNNFASDDEYDFYYIYSTNDDKNHVKGIKITGDKYIAEEICEADKIRNIALIDGKLYGRIDGGDYKLIQKQE